MDFPQWTSNITQADISGPRGLRSSAFDDSLGCHGFERSTQPLTDYPLRKTFLPFGFSYIDIHHIPPTNTDDKMRSIPVTFGYLGREPHYFISGSSVISSSMFDDSFCCRGSEGSIQPIDYPLG